jgi:hypothetical protein
MTAFVPGTDEKDMRRLVMSLQQLAAGRSNATGTVTLATGTTTTTVTDANCSGESVPHLTPNTANAASEVATTYVSSVSKGSFVITHASNATADRTFLYALQG